MEDAAIVDTIVAMRNQEEHGYIVNENLWKSSNKTPHHDCGTRAPDVGCRLRMAQWCYKIADHCKLNREIVEISMSYFDRYLCTETGLRRVCSNRKIFQLAAMTCFYTATKIHGEESLNSEMVVQLSKGYYTKEQVESMELSILQALQWRMHPPTAMAYVYQLMALIPYNVIFVELRNPILKLVKYQTEIAVRDCGLASARAWSIAAAALLNALEWCGNKPAEDLVRRLLFYMTLECDFENIFQYVRIIQSRIACAAVLEHQFDVDENLFDSEDPTQETR